MLNKSITMGRFVADPELKQTPAGQSVCNFTMAVDRDYKNQDGTYDTDFIDYVAWRGTAEFVSKFFAKGSLAIVEGRLQIRKWVDKDGNNRRTAEIVATDIHFGGSKKDEGDAGTVSHNTVAGPAPTSAPLPTNNYAMTNDDEELPF